MKKPRSAGERPTRTLHRWLPPGWQGHGRQAQWRRARARRVLAGLLVGCAVLAVVGAVRPADPATYPVTVAARDLPAGSRLGASDVRQARWSRSDRVPGIVPAGSVAGTVLTGPIRAGEPVTSARVRSARTWPGLAADRVVVGVASGDTALLRVLQAGDRVDLIDTGKGTTIASGVPVVSIPSATHAAGNGPASLGTDWKAADAPGVLVAVSPAQAAAVGSATAARSGGVGGGIQLALRAGR